MLNSWLLSVFGLSVFSTFGRIILSVATVVELSDFVSSESCTTVVWTICSCNDSTFSVVVTSVIALDSSIFETIEACVLSVIWFELGDVEYSVKWNRAVKPRVVCWDVGLWIGFRSFGSLVKMCPFSVVKGKETSPSVELSMPWLVTWMPFSLKEVWTWSEYVAVSETNSEVICSCCKFVW